MLKKLKTIISYRGFIYGTVKREFQLRYQGALLGVLWTVLQPLMMIFVYTAIFSQLMRARLPGIDSAFAYSIYICAGILTWSLFTEIITRSSTVFIENANLIKKSNFPKICLPTITVISALINFGIVFILFNIYLVITNNFPGIVIIGVIPVLLMEIVFAMGLGLLLGTLNVFFRDMGQMTTIMLQLWFWSTPIVYPLSVLPEWAKNIVAYNPMTAMVSSYQAIFVNKQWPVWQSLAPTLIFTLLILAMGLMLFYKRSPEMVDEL